MKDITAKREEQASEELELDDELLKGIVFIGQTLGPLYLKDPVKDGADSLFEAFASLDRAEVAQEWPFVTREVAEACLAQMQEGLQHGHSSDDVVWEYRRLFIGPAPKPAPPWGSVYTDRDGVVFGGTTLDLRQWMRENGISRVSDEGAPEDHIGLMLLLMAWIAEYKPLLLKQYLAEHFFTWTTHFLDQLAEAAQQPFYEGLARLTKESLEGIQEALGLMIEYPRFYR